MGNLNEDSVKKPDCVYIGRNTDRTIGFITDKIKNGVFEIIICSKKELHQNIEEIVQQKVSQIEDKQEQKRLKYCLIELLENINKYAIIGGEKVARATLTENQNTYTIYITNFGKLESFQKLQNKISEINKMNLEETNETKTDWLENSEISKEGGAGIGMISIAQKIRKTYPDLKNIFELQVISEDKTNQDPNQIVEAVFTVHFGPQQIDTPNDDYKPEQIVSQDQK